MPWPRSLPRARVSVLRVSKPAQSATWVALFRIAVKSPLS